MDKEELKQLLKELLTEDMEINLEIGCTESGFYGGSASTRFTVSITYDGDEIYKSSDTLYHHE